MFDPSFLALTRTPSSASCPAVTLPESAGPACAAGLPVPASHTAATRQPMLVTIELRNMPISLDLAFCYYGSDCRGRISRRLGGRSAEPVCDIRGTIAKARGTISGQSLETGGNK